jgi:hypothetical protein
VTNSLGLDDDLDGVELVQNLEKAFEIQIADSEAESILTVGQLYDLLLQKIPANESNRKCASAMAFYRLKRALKGLGYEAPSPSTGLSFLEGRGAKISFKKLEHETGLRLPRPELSYGGFFGCLAVVIIFCVVLGFSAFLHRRYFSGINGFTVVVVFIVVGWGILYFDPGKLPKSCSTLGGLARKVAALNYGRFIKTGANHRDSEIWNNLLELLSEYALPKSEIGRDTYFLQSQFRKNA